MGPEKDPPGAPAGGCACNRNNPEAGCTACGASPLAYWCDVCRQQVPEKRCPLCGLKARRIRLETRRGNVIG